MLVNTQPATNTHIEHVLIYIHVFYVCTGCNDMGYVSQHPTRNILGAIPHTARPHCSSCSARGACRHWVWYVCMYVWVFSHLNESRPTYHVRIRILRCPAARTAVHSELETTGAGEYVLMYACMYVRMYVWVYVCMYACMYIWAMWHTNESCHIRMRCVSHMSDVLFNRDIGQYEY